MQKDGNLCIGIQISKVTPFVRPPILRMSTFTTAMSLLHTSSYTKNRLLLVGGEHDFDAVLGRVIDE